MRKILVLVAATAIASNPISLITAANSYDKLTNNNLPNYSEQKQRQKRGLNDNQDEIEISKNFITDNITLYASFRPLLWKGIRLYRDPIAASEADFMNLFAALMLSPNQNIYIDSKVKDIIPMLALGKEIWNNWDKINNFWKNSDKKHRIRILVAINLERRVSVFSKGKKIGDWIWSEYISTNIRDDENEMI